MRYQSVLFAKPVEFAQVMFTVPLTIVALVGAVIENGSGVLLIIADIGPPVALVALLG